MPTAHLPASPDRLGSRTHVRQAYFHAEALLTRYLLSDQSPDLTSLLTSKLDGS